MNDSAQQNNNQPNVMPVDTSMGDGNSVPPFPVGGANPPQAPVQNAVQPAPASTPPTDTQGSAAPTTPVAEPAVADATAGNQPAINETPPPPGDGQTITTFKPVRGKFGPKGMIATVFGILVLVAATVVGITQVGQTQIFREKASSQACGVGLACTTTQIPGSSGCLTTENGSTQASYCCSAGQVIVDGPDGQSCGTAGQQTTTDTSTTEQTSCSGGLTLCNGQCVDTTSDPSNCGSCGTTCNGSSGGAQLVCSNSLCDTQGGGATGCPGWTRFSCPNVDTSGQGCTDNPTTVSGPDQWIANFCGSQQIDCNVGSYDVSKITLTGPACGQTPPPGGGNTLGCNGCDCGVIDANGSSNRQNCYWDGNQCLYSEAACSSGPSAGKAKCGAVGIQVNGEFTKKNGKVANGWHTATLTEVQQLQPGDTVRFTVSAGAASGANNPDWSQFTKGRFSINGGAYIITDVHTDLENDRIGLFGRVFQYDYVIPAGITDFVVQGQVYYAKGQNPGWH